MDDHFETAGANTGLLGVAQRDGHYRVVALAAIPAGQPLLELEGRLIDSPSRDSVQVVERLHIAPPAGLEPADTPQRYLWRFLNHACAPNAAFVGRTLIALREIRVGEEVGFDYNTTEYAIDEPFTCHCGACDGRTIRGFRHLDAAERERLRPWLAAHLVDRAADAAPV